jgi:hypothetical protein
MDITVEELLKGKPTIIKGKNYFGTAAYVEPFLERLHNVTDDFRVHVQLPDQITRTVNGDINTDDITYNRVYIEAVIPDDECYIDHDKVIGMVMGLDTRKPVAKFYSGSLNAACTNLCVFDPSYLFCQQIEPETPLDFKPLDKVLDMKDATKEILTVLHETHFRNCVEDLERRLGSWCRNAMHISYSSGLQPVKLSIDSVIQAYKSLFEKEDSDYYQVGDTVNMFDVYNAFTQQITNSRDKGKDLINMFEKTLLLRDILSF